MERSELLEKYAEGMPVLDHGFVRLIDVMGDDKAVEDAARTSYRGQGKDRTALETRRLLRYLMRHRHSGPFEMAEIKLHVKLPIFVARQMVRHRTASLNEVSARYTKMPPEFHVPEPEQVCGPPTTNKQGRAEPLPPSEAAAFLAGYEKLCQASYDAYDSWTDGPESLQVAAETARMVLPLSMYTEWYWKIDAHNLMHFLSLRLDEHAQYEIRVYAEAIAKIVEDWLPVTWEAFQDYRLGAYTLSRAEVEAVQWMAQNPRLEAESLADYHQRVRAMIYPLMSPREVKAFSEKFLRTPVSS